MKRELGLDAIVIEDVEEEDEFLDDAMPEMPSFDFQ